MIKSCSVEDTVEIAKNFGSQIPEGGLVFLYGGLGVGKTVFVKGLVEVFEGSPEAVSSPTFTIMQHYPGRISIAHVDLYRLSMREVSDLGLEEIIEDSGLTVIEWAERIPDSYPEAVKVIISDSGEDQRTFDIRFP